MSFLQNYLSKRTPKGSYYTSELVLPMDLETLILYISEVFLLIMAYILLFFRPLDYFEFRHSLLLLIAMTVAGCVWPFLLSKRKESFIGPFFLNLPLGPGFYSLITYRPFISDAVIVLMMIGCLIPPAITLLHFFLTPFSFRLLMEKMAESLLLSMRLISFVSMLFVIVLTFIPALQAPKRQEKDDTPAVIINRDPDLDLVGNFIIPDTWNHYSQDEKLKLMQQLADQELQMLGVNDKVPVLLTYRDINDNMLLVTSAYYVADEHVIHVNADSFQKMSGSETMRVLLHELRHCYQHHLAELYLNASEEERNLAIFNDAKIFYNNFLEYNPGKSLSSFPGYYLQPCEQDARGYAKYVFQCYVEMYSKRLKGELKEFPTLNRNRLFVDS